MRVAIPALPLRNVSAVSFFTNSRDKMDVKPQGPPPIYDPGVVADCVLYAAEHPVRDLFAGGAAKMMATMQMLAPGLVDRQLARSLSQSSGIYNCCLATGRSCKPH